VSTLRFNTWQNTGGTEVANSTLGIGKILQVVRATDTTERTTTSTSFVDANISVTITPTSISSDILLLWVFRIEASGSGNSRGRFQITDSSNTAISGTEEVTVGMNATTTNYHSLTMTAYDSPATTSATTYKGRFRSESSTTIKIQNAGATGQLFAIEVSA